MYPWNSIIIVIVFSDNQSLLDDSILPPNPVEMPSLTNPLEITSLVPMMTLPPTQKAEDVEDATAATEDVEDATAENRTAYITV